MMNGSRMITVDVVILPLGPQSSGEKPSQELVELRMKLDLRRKAVQAIIDNRASSRLNALSHLGTDGA